jgi:hypothetical protein
MKAEMKEKTMRMFLVSQKHIVYTEPLEIRAGTTVDVLYNPSNTVLNGKPEVWFRCSFNRWMHPGGVLPPQNMVKAENGSHLKATGLSFLRGCLLYYTFFCGISYEPPYYLSSYTHPFFPIYFSSLHPNALFFIPNTSISLSFWFSVHPPFYTSQFLCPHLGWQVIWDGVSTFFTPLNNQW